VFPFIPNRRNRRNHLIQIARHDDLATVLRTDQIYRRVLRFQTLGQSCEQSCDSLELLNNQSESCDKKKCTVSVSYH